MAAFLGALRALVQPDQLSPALQQFLNQSLAQAGRDAPPVDGADAGGCMAGAEGSLSCLTRESGMLLLGMSCTGDSGTPLVMETCMAWPLLAVLRPCAQACMYRWARCLLVCPKLGVEVHSVRGAVPTQNCLCLGFGLLQCPSSLGSMLKPSCMRPRRICGFLE